MSAKSIEDGLAADITLESIKTDHVVLVELFQEVRTLVIQAHQRHQLWDLKQADRFLKAFPSL